MRIEKRKESQTNMSNKRMISVIVPAYNESESILELYQGLKATFSDTRDPYEFIFIDDGSTDETFSKLEKIHEDDDHVAVVRLATNCGKSRALQSGFEVAQGDIIMMMDSDLQYEPAECVKLFRLLDEGYDLVVGLRRNRKDTRKRILLSKVYNRVTSLITGIKIHDFNCGIKACVRPVIENIALYGQLHRYFPVLAERSGYRVGEVPISHHPRKYGGSRYGKERLLQGFWDLITVLFLTRFKDHPLHLFGTVGLALSTLSIVIPASLKLLDIFHIDVSWENPYFISLLVVIFLFGVQLISIGFLGELLTHFSIGTVRRNPVRTLLRARRPYTSNEK
jgi:glycosyltransferase involved in cell wall biosynthesis